MFTQIAVPVFSLMIQSNATNRMRLSSKTSYSELPYFYQTIIKKYQHIVLVSFDFVRLS